MASLGTFRYLLNNHDGLYTCVRNISADVFFDRDVLSCTWRTAPSLSNKINLNLLFPIERQLKTIDGVLSGIMRRKK